MFGDFLREAAVLVMVFYPLDRYFSYMHQEHVTNTVPVSQIVGLSAILLIAGIVLERVDFGVITLRIVNWALRKLNATREKLEGRDKK